MTARQDAHSEYTDDLSVIVAPNRSLEELVDFVVEKRGMGAPRNEIMQVLTTRFGLSFEDARLSLDRVAGGICRAATNAPSNEPNPEKDPVAHISYQRALDRCGPVHKRTRSTAWLELVRLIGLGDQDSAIAFTTSSDFANTADGDELQAAKAWVEAVDGSAKCTKAVSSVFASVYLSQLVEAMGTAEVDSRVFQRSLLQARTGLSAAVESVIESVGEKPCASAGTSPWFDAIELGEAARRLSVCFRNLGDLENEARALNIRGRITTRLLAHCPHRIGPAMLDSADCARRQGNEEQAISFCTAVIADFARIVSECEEDDAPVLDEQELAIRQLVQAIDLFESIQGSVQEDHQDLRHRCVAALKRSPSNE